MAAEGFGDHEHFRLALHYPERLAAAGVDLTAHQALALIHDIEASRAWHAAWLIDPRGAIAPATVTCIAPKPGSSRGRASGLVLSGACIIAVAAVLGAAGLALALPDGGATAPEGVGGVIADGAGAVDGVGVTQAGVTVIDWASCTAAEAAGTAPLYAGESGYRAALDPDGDGIACDSPEHPGVGVPPMTATSVYPDCAAVWAALGRGLFLGDPEYESRLDRNGDGIECETDPR